MIHIGNRIYGAAAIALGLVGLAWGDFAAVWQPVSNTMDRPASAAVRNITFMGRSDSVAGAIAQPGMLPRDCHALPLS